MATMQDIESQCKVAQLYVTICNYSNSKITKHVLDKTVDVNCRIPHKIFPANSESKLKCCTMLQVSYFKGSIENFELLLKYGADFTVKDQQGSTILHHIINDIQQEILSSRKPLINPFVNAVLSAHVQFGNHANPCNENGLSHFHVAAIANQVEAVKLFIDSGVPIDQITNVDSLMEPGYSPLHFAVEHCCLKTIEFLISNAANMHLKNANGKTPLHLLIEQRLVMFDSKCVAIGEECINAWNRKIELNEKIISILLENDSTNSESKDHIGLLKFHVACTFQDSFVLKCLLDRVADINQCVNEDSPVWPGYTGLHFAAHCSISMIRLLIEGGADMIARDAKGTTPLDICMRWFTVEDMHSIVSLMPQLQNVTFIPHTQTTCSNDKIKLLDYIFVMLDPNKLDRFLHDDVDFNMHLPKDSPLWPSSTPLHLAFRFNRDKVVFSLLGILAKPWIEPINLSDEYGSTYLHIDCVYNASQHRLATKILSTKSLVETSVNAVYTGQPMTSLKPGWTPLHIAVTKGSQSLVEVLLEHGADVNRRDTEGFSPVHWTFNTDKREIANLLLTSKQLKESVVEDVGLTHLHVAAWFGNDKAIARLLRMGANVEASITGNKNLREFEGCTPLHLAVINEKFVSTMLLLKLGADLLAKKSNGVSPLFEALTVKNDVILNAFVQSIWLDSQLRRRLEEELGLSMLHVACRALDVDKISTLLRDKDADVNARTRDDLNFWPGFTPLHVLVESQPKHVGKKAVFDVALGMLLMNGADVAATNVEGCTPIHLASTMQKIDPSVIALMLKSQRDFSVDPVNDNGMSHFHCACASGDLESVKKFLQQGRVDVNRQVNFVASKYAGYSPLHFAVSSIQTITGLRDEEAQRCIIEMLLTRGAKVNAQDICGCTPLHVLIRESKSPRRLILMSKILGFCDNVDTNVRSIDGQTPMEILVTSPESVEKLNVWLEELKLLITSGCRINTCNSVTDEGYIALALSHWTSRHRGLAYAEIVQTIEQASGFSGVDDLNRNGIHSLLASKHSRVVQETYEMIIDTCVRHGCDVDQQDRFGNTPLHLAVKFGNWQATAALLVSSADINVIDSDGKSAFSFHFGFGRRSNSFMSWNLVWHVYDLTLLGIHVSRLNKNVLADALKEFRLQNAVEHLNSFNNEIKHTEGVKIGRRGLTLRSFLLETAAISVYPSLTPAERDEIIGFFKSFDYTRCGALKFAIKLQFKKVTRRLSLIAEAENSFESLIDFPLPDKCVRVILKFLGHSDLNNLIAAFVNDDMKMHVD